MNDKELLEFAAKAAGYDVRWHDAWQCFTHVGPFNTTTPPTLSGQRMVWVPLDDDGDALRLAVKLELNVNIERTKVDVYDRNLKLTRVWAEEVADQYAATRRAIVRAAAEIGKAM